MRAHPLLLHTLLLSGLIALSACQEKPVATPLPSSAVKIGKPYTVLGKTYYPEHNPSYDEVGEASWYGPGFHGKNTANGETFDQHDLTAAHPTLPMPSLVQVTNLQNGKELVVRINDRGPFKNNRIIDLSKKSAQMLDITGTAQVRVRYLERETEHYIAALNNGKPADVQTALADAAQAKRTATNAEIAERIVNGDPGEPVSNAAPVMSVVSRDLEATRPTPEVAVREETQHPKLVQAAYNAEEIGFSSLSSPSLSARPKIVHTSSPDSKPKGHYYVQAGAFASEENAKKLSETLRPLGEVRTAIIPSGGRTWHRVRVGGVATYAEAQALRASVQNATGVVDTRIVRE